MAFERVARLDEIAPGRGHCVRVRGREIGLYRVGADLHAMDNACPHAGYPLHEGELEGGVVYCAGHGWPFDVTTGRPPDVLLVVLDAALWLKAGWDDFCDKNVFVDASAQQRRDRAKQPIE